MENVEFKCKETLRFACVFYPLATDLIIGQLGQLTDSELPGHEESSSGLQRLRRDN